MPRIRTIKPEFWTDGDVVELSPFARLLFIGTWNFAICDRGHVADDPKRLKMQVLPADSVDPIELIDELLAAGRLDRLTLTDGRTVLHIRRFTDHQKIEKRWNPRCYACDSLGLNDPPETSPDLSEPPARLGEKGRTSPNLPDSPPTSDQEGKGKEGKGEKSGARERGTRLQKDWIPSEPVRQQMAMERPEVDLKAEHLKFLDHWVAVPGLKGTKLDWDATWRNWIRNARTAGPSKPSQAVPAYSPLPLPPEEELDWDAAS